MKLRTLGWAIAAVWAVGMTWAMARIAGTLDSLASRSEQPRVTSAPVPAGPSEIAFSLRAPPPPTVPPTAAPVAPAADDVEAAPASPDQEAAHDRADDLIAQMVAKGSVDDASLGDLRQAITEMRPQDRVKVMGAFAAAATRGEIKVAPEDYGRILP
jgi:hypothetical protein